MGFNPFRILAHAFGGMGMFGALRIFIDILLNRAPSLLQVLGVCFLSGLLISLAWFLIELDD